MPDSIFKSVAVGRAYELLRHEHFEYFKKLQNEMHFEYVRFHGLFHDDMGVVVRDKNGKLHYRWHNIDKAFDSLKAVNIKPLVQLGAMPKALASGEETIFHWQMNVTKPKDYNEWYELVRNFVSHMVDRYGYDEVKTWYFEVWNEPNLKGFWPHGMEEYYNLYSYAAKGVKAVGKDLRVGGPATAGGDYVKELIEYCCKNNIPLDFITTHAYPVGEYCEYPEREGSPYKLGEYFQGRFKEVYNIVKNSEKPDLEIHWTEWNTQSTDSSKHITWTLNPTVDMHYGASCVAKEMLSVMNYCNSAAYWTLSDLFEEDGPKHSPFSCTYGLMTIDGIPKATYNAYKFLRKLRGKLMDAEFTNTPPLMCNICATEENGVMRAVLYNHNALEIKNQPDFSDTVSIDTNNDGEYIVTTAVIKESQGSAYETWLKMGKPQNLSPIQQEMLEAHSIPEYSFMLLTSKNGKVEIPFTLKPNEVMYMELQKKSPATEFNIENQEQTALLNEMLMLDKKTN